MDPRRWRRWPPSRVGQSASAPMGRLTSRRSEGEQATHALSIGAAFVVVGTVITNMEAITRRFVQALRTND